MKTDIEIAQANDLEAIERIAHKTKISSDYLELYGKYKAKINLDIEKDLIQIQNGKLILVTAITPTKAGEGKSTTTVSLVDGLAHLNKNVIGCMREPSLGPVFGIKGGATGGGYAQIVPMEDINLHFTGDMHAITSANNLISALIDNSIYQGNTLNINSDKILWKRCMDMNDRALRDIEISRNDKKATPRTDSFIITVASPLMATLCLSKDLIDLRKRLSATMIAYNLDDQPVTLADLHCVGSIILLLKDAIKPNLVQTLEKNPVFVHGGPFANIAHGSNSIIATRLALKLADYVVTEAGFGSDLGAQKFMDITCVNGEFKPSAVVLVCTVRALKLHGNESYDNLKIENVEAVKKGLPNLKKHTEILETYQVPYVVTLNRFSSDSKAEVDCVEAWCKTNNIEFVVCDGWERGSDGALDLSHKVLDLCNRENHYRSILDANSSIETKIETIAKKIYGANGVEYSALALSQLKDIYKNKFEHLNVCIAKTQASVSDDPKLLGYPSDFNLHVRDLHVSSGAGFVVVIAGSIMTMPGLSKDPAAYHIDMDQSGNIVGLF
ncbi:MAG: formate--tetrahydrofolate ligase [Erysipelotrichaceae bacterium]